MISGRRISLLGPDYTISGYCFSEEMRTVLPTAMRLALPIICSVFTIYSNDSARTTTIVVARTENEIVVGADSKVTDTFTNDVTRHACKILPVGKLIIAIEGFETDRQTGFSAPEIAMKASLDPALVNLGPRPGHPRHD